MATPAIVCDGITKRFLLGERVAYGRLSESIQRLVVRRRATGERVEFTALDDLSFRIDSGEVVGIIGRNGAGKSTLLKVLSRITEPTSGRALVYGRVGALLEVGTGFHPELTGRENVYLNGAVLGMRHREISRKFSDIVEFANVEQFVDTPVKRYSSGMKVRLAFAVAAHLEPEIMLVDEVLAVGDAQFQRRCLGRIGEIAREGRTVLFVSHDMAAITRTCPRAMWIDRGRVAWDGPSTDAVAHYLAAGTDVSNEWRPGPADVQSGPVSIERLTVRTDQDGAAPDFGRPFDIDVEFSVADGARGAIVAVRITDMKGNIVFTSWENDTQDLSTRGQGHYLASCRITPHLLRPGRYWITVFAVIPNMADLVQHANVLPFDVSEVGYPANANRVGVITPILQWRTASVEAYQPDPEALPYA